MLEDTHACLFTPTSDPRWRLEVNGFDQTLEPTIEAVLALVNGYCGVRAALEEGSPISRAATFVAGVFNTPAQAQAPELEAPIPELVVVPDWSRLRISSAGHELRSDQVELLEQRRMLDMRQGVLLREWRVRDSAGHITRLRSVRFASLAERHALVQWLELTPENYSDSISLTSLVDSHVSNENNTIHLAPLTIQTPESHHVLTLRTRQSGYTLALAAHAQLHTANGAVAGTARSTDRELEQRWEWQAHQGQHYVLRKIVTLVTSRDTAQPSAVAAQLLEQLQAGGHAQLLDQHRRAWATRWEHSDAEIGSDDETQRQVRFALYHLIGAAHPDEHASVGARALTGERYRGHVFWDNETFVWPFYLYTAPETARALLMYRYNTINGARNKARAMGYHGALYAWESTDTGEETTPPYINVPGLGRQAVLTGIEEHHIAADIAYAICQYRQASSDEAFFLDYGAEMLLDIARFWASRAVPGQDGQYHILQVIGPDEYHESVNDNAYTNVMAQWTLRQALQTTNELRTMHPGHWQALAHKLQLNPQEEKKWRAIADRMLTGFDPTSQIYEQFAGYFQLQEVDLRGHDTANQTMDVKLGWAALQKTKVLKQSDVVMLMFLLWDQFAPAVREANYRYYEPRTAHDSSLSPSFHALMAARLNDLPLAIRYLRQAALIDLDFSRKGWAGATGGVHIAALGGIWQALAFGFLGMRPHAEGLRFEPHIPGEWATLRMPICWRGSRLRITATASQIEVVVESGQPVQVALDAGAWHTIAPGEHLQSKSQ